MPLLNLLECQSNKVASLHLCSAQLFMSSLAFKYQSTGNKTCETNINRERSFEKKEKKLEGKYHSHPKIYLLQLFDGK